MDNLALDLADVRVAYRHQPVLSEVHLRLPNGKIIGVLGPNGAGKSTLLKTVMGLVEPSAGNIKILGQPIRKIRSEVAYIPQRTSIDWDFPVSVFDAVLMGTYPRLRVFQRPGNAEKEWARHCLETVGLERFSKRQIGELSGGQQQRVFVARALAQRAQLLLLDEPFVGIDATSEARIVNILHDLVRNDGKTVVVVHHNLSNVDEYFDHVVLINKTVITDGSPQIAMQPQYLGETFGEELLNTGFFGGASGTD